MTILIGDVHGSFKPVRELYLRHKNELDNSKDENYLICLGDLGALYYFNYRDEDFKKKLGTYPFTYLVIRGNHEARPSERAFVNPKDWDIEKLWGGYVWVEKQYPYIKYALDAGEVYDIPLNNNNNEETIRTLVIPGAYSVDKEARLDKGWFWEPHEQLTTMEMRWLSSSIESDPNYDLILTHTCPLKYQPSNLFLDYVNQDNVDNTMEKFLDWVEENVNYKAWCWGHYHQWLEYPAYRDGRRKLMLFNDYGALLSDVMNDPSTTMVPKY